MKQILETIIEESNSDINNTIDKRKLYYYYLKHKNYVEIFETLGNKIILKLKKTPEINKDYSDYYLYCNLNNNILKIENGVFYSIGRINGVDFQIKNEEISRIHIVLYSTKNKLFIIDSILFDENNDNNVQVFEKDKSFELELSKFCKLFFVTNECINCGKKEIFRNKYCYENHKYLCNLCNLQTYECYFCNQSFNNILIV
jgi:hypothetical protein